MKDELLELLNDLEQYMDDRADIVDGRNGTPVANKEMVLLGRIQDSIIQIKKDTRLTRFKGSVECIMEYGIICKHDDHFLCEHRIEWIENYFKQKL